MGLLKIFFKAILIFVFNTTNLEFKEVEINIKGIYEIN